VDKRSSSKICVKQLFLADRSPTCGLPDQEGATLTDSITDHLDDIGKDLTPRGDPRASKSFIQSKSCKSRDQILYSALKVENAVNGN